MEDKVNALFKAVRTYAVDLTRKGIDDNDQRKVTALLRYTASLENSGDVICKTMIGIPEAMKKEGKQFSAEGKEEANVVNRRGKSGSLHQCSRGQSTRARTNEGQVCFHGKK